MNKTMQKVLSIVLATLMCITSLPLFAAADDSQPREWFVSLSGDDVNGTGSIDKPFRTLQKGADMLKAGDTLHIREGVYDEVFTVKSSGTAEAPITIKNYNDEPVTVRATTAVTGWTATEDKNIWVANVPEDAISSGGNSVSLFNGDHPLLVARYPNIPEGGSKMWPVNLTMDKAERVMLEGQEVSYIIDAELNQEEGYWAGASVCMQAGLNWYNIYADVATFKDSRLDLIDHSLGLYSYYVQKDGQPYYIFDHYNCIDTTDEYWIDEANGKVYYYSKTNPNNESIGMRNNTYTIDLSGQNYVDIIGIGIFAAAPILTDDCSHINFEWTTMASFEGALHLRGDHNTIKHSHLYDAPERIVSIYGKCNAMFNCLVENTGWRGQDPSGVKVEVEAMNAYVGYNTMTGAGRTVFAAAGTNSVYEFNHFYNAGSITHDTGITYAGVFSGGTSEFRYNWLHDMTAGATAMGLYFDNAGSNVVIHHNVVWDNENDTGELIPTGWRALLLNDPAQGFSVYNNTFIGGASMSRTLSIANDGRYMNNIFTGEIATAVQHDALRNNILGWLDPGFVDMYNYDFTLRSDSIAIDKGIEIDGVTEGFNGNAPDIGAYEYGGEYWVPGHNWENPPVFEHKVPNYVQYHNLVANSGFESDAVDETFDKDHFGWSIMDETDGQVKTAWFHSLSETAGVRRTGNVGIQLGETPASEYPGDEVAELSQKVLDTYNEISEGYIDYPEWRSETLYTDLPDTLYGLLVNSSNMTPWGGFEVDEWVSHIACVAENTEEEVYSGKMAWKVSDIEISWGGLRPTLPAVPSERIYRTWSMVKGPSGSYLDWRWTDHSPTDWSLTYDRFLGNYQHSYSGGWDVFSYDISTGGPTQGIAMEMYFGKYDDGEVYYFDDWTILDITELYTLKDICATNKKASDVINKALANRKLTSEDYAMTMKLAAQYMIESDPVTAFDSLVPLMIELRNSKLSAGAGLTYTVDNVKPGRTYKLQCHAWVANEQDKVEYRVKHGDEVIAYWETNSTSWTDDYILFEAPENGDPVTIEVWKPMGIAAAYVDDIEVREYDPTVYKSRDGKYYIENTEMESGELWPWYSYDGDLELVATDKGTSLKVTNGRAMQDIYPLRKQKKYEFAGDFKLNMLGVASKEVEIRYNVMQEDGQRVSYVVAKGTITNDGWTHLAGTIEVPKEASFNSIAYTAGFVGGGNGSFYLDNAYITEMASDVVEVGADDSMSFEEIMADTDNWVSQSGDQGLILDTTGISSTNGAVAYTGSLRDFRITFDMRINGYGSGWPSLTIRNNNRLRGWWYEDGYTFIFSPTQIEFQCWQEGTQTNLFVGTDPENYNGLYGPATQTTAFKMDDWNRVTVGSKNEETGGVRIYLEVNGEVIYDFLHETGTIDNAGAIVFSRNLSDEIAVRVPQD